ncbi:MAG: pyridoxamine 5'-phosphate oxidase family protein [Bacteroidales bacterium]|nr:pyridoxamine 5'-phosphate oxidase family protein [Bacteroidales bacterium]
MTPDPRIVKFLKKHHVLTVCSTVDDEPWCANCFYVYLEDENAFVFTSDSETRHGREFLLNSSVAGSVVLETGIIGKIQGVQFRGTVTIAEGERLRRAEKAYIKRFPVAALMDTRSLVCRP